MAGAKRGRIKRTNRKWQKRKKNKIKTIRIVCFTFFFFISLFLWLSSCAFVFFATFHYSYFLLTSFGRRSFFCTLLFSLFSIATISSVGFTSIVSVWYAISFRSKMVRAFFPFDLYLISDGKRWGLWALIELRRKKKERERKKNSTPRTAQN